MTVSGILIFLSGTYLSWFIIQILISELTFALTSLVCLSGAAVFEKYPNLSKTTIVSAGVSFFLLMSIIWLSEVYSNLEYQTRDQAFAFVFYSIFLSIFLMHTSLLLLIKSRHSLVDRSRIGTIGASGLLTLVLCFFVQSIFSGGFYSSGMDFLYRLMGVLGILSVAGTIATLILNVYFKNSEGR